MKENMKSSPDIVDGVVENFSTELPFINSLTLETVCRLIMTGRRFEQSAAAMLKTYGFNYTDFDVLGMLRSSGAPYELTPTDLLRFTMITSGSMTTCLDRLERSGMVERRHSLKDRRVRIISLTEKGKSTIEAALEARYQTAEHMLSALTPSERRALNATLKTISAPTHDT